MDENAAAAAVAAEAVRALDHHTMRPVSPGSPGWAELADLGAVVAELAELARRLHQALDKVGGAVLSEPGTRYATDGADLDADDRVEVAALALVAAELARSLPADL